MEPEIYYSPREESSARSEDDYNFYAWCYVCTAVLIANTLEGAANVIARGHADATGHETAVLNGEAPF